MKFEITEEYLAFLRAHTKDEASTRAVEQRVQLLLEQAEQRRRDDEHLYRALLNHIPNSAMIVFDHDLRFRLAEGVALKAVGITAQDVEGRTLQEVVSASSIVFLEPYYRRALNGETLAAEISDITGHIYELRFAPVKRDDQVIAGMIFVQDVTERQQAERALRESEFRYRSLVEAQAELVCRFYPDTRLTFVNEAYCQFVGKSAAALLGRSFMHLVPESSQEIALSQIAQLLKAPNEVLHTENRLVTGDGDIRWVEWISRTVTNETGDVLEIQAAGRDITERKQAELALRESEEHFRQIAEGVREAFVIRDVDADRFLYVSPQYQTITGYPLSAIYDDPFHLIGIAHPDDRDMVEKLLLKTMERGETFSQYYRIYHADGTLRWIWGRNFPVRNAEGKIYRQVGIIEDITERKLKEEQSLQLMLEQQRMKLLTDFVTSASHEFRTPLSLINMSLYLMNRAADLERRGEFSIRIQREVDKIAQLVDHLLLMTRLDSEIGIQQASVNLNDVIELAYVSLEQSIRQKNHQYTADLMPDLPTVIGDIELLRRAVNALLSNAIQYTDPGGSIRITTSAEAGNVLLAVEDNGIGIGKEALPLVFNRFFREDASHSTAGFGLGLSIARRVAELHGGTITVQSEVGRGSVFTLVLPAAPNNSQMR